jgi:hypothetical protein
VGSTLVVEGDEDVDVGLEFGDRGGLDGLGSQPFLQGLLESLDLAAGRRMVGGRVDLDYVQAT